VRDCTRLHILLHIRLHIAMRLDVLSAPPADLSSHQDETRRLVRAMMTLTGLTASGLARAAGLTPSTLNRFMSKDVAHVLSQRTMLAVLTQTLRVIKDRPVEALDAVAMTALLPAITHYDSAIRERAPEVTGILAALKSQASPVRAPAPEPQAAPDLPVIMVGSQGIDVARGDFARAPLRTQRPPFLAADPQAFAILMPDQSMAPRFDAGDMLYASPARALGPETRDVVIDRGNGFTVATLIGHSPGTVRIATLAPRTRTTLERAKLKGVYPIVGLQRLGG
jgi:hypothetical protein